jgi:hypothetical protein
MKLFFFTLIKLKRKKNGCKRRDEHKYDDDLVVKIFRKNFNSISRRLNIHNLIKQLHLM